jgi:murein DD-endopeptidase MepM/ murein hydrolase activator NlpD
MFRIMLLILSLQASTLMWSDAYAQNVPVTPVPPSYGHYCSITYPGGGFAFATLPGINSDPCGDLLKSSSSRGTIRRAGLWATKSDNNVLVTCGDGDVGVLRDTGGKATSVAYNNSAGKKNCIFTVSPVRLPVFGYPYGKTTPSQPHPSADVSVGRGFDYDVYNRALKASDFGQPAGHSHTVGEPNWIDRKGRQRCSSSKDNDGNTKHSNGEAAYDLRMPAGKPITSMADGIVRSARWRDVSAYGCGKDRQAEIYIEHQVGTGEYAERFISYYAHMSTINVKTGDKVTRGEKIGGAGNTGCAGRSHLHFSVMRLTNLSGHRSYDFQTTDDGYGVNGIHGVIDPFGWSGPKQIDPWAWKFLKHKGDSDSLKNPGAFSIHLWRDGVSVPWQW